MNTKILMTSSSLFLGLAGIFSLFAPDVLLSTLNLPKTNPAPVLIQLMGAMYFSFALMNWTAKDSLIGGIYARPVSLANFSHFFSGVLLLIKYQLSNEMNAIIIFVLFAYTIYTFLFYWLVFRHTGIVVKHK